eukprot:g22585.t1
MIGATDGAPEGKTALSRANGISSTDISLQYPCSRMSRLLARSQARLLRDVHCCPASHTHPLVRFIGSLAAVAEALKGIPQTPANFPAAKLEACAGPVPSPHAIKRPDAADLPSSPSTWNRRFHALDADPATIPPPARTLAELKAQLKEREGKRLPTPISLPPRSISKPDTFEQWLYEKELYAAELKFYKENLPAEFKPQKIRDGPRSKHWRGAELGAIQQAKLRKEALLHGLIWPWEKPIKPRRPTIFKGRNRVVKKLERQVTIAENMKRMPELIAAYRKKTAEYRTQKRFERMDAVERLLVFTTRDDLSLLLHTQHLQLILNS